MMAENPAMPISAITYNVSISVTKSGSNEFLIIEYEKDASAGLSVRFLHIHPPECKSLPWSLLQSKAL
jgi:hypothetical protein